MRLDKALQIWEMAPSRTKAQELLRAGLVERLTPLGWILVQDTSLEVDEHADRDHFRLRDIGSLRFVSRGGLKLDAALDHFRISCQGIHALDVGLSTGGFADCLLQRGAESIVGVDVGHGQLAAKLKGEDRLQSIEGLNARELSRTPAMEAFKHAPFDLITIDVSFISLSLILPELGVFLKRPTGRVLALVKPQFELSPGDLSAGGIVLRPEGHQRALARVAGAALDAGLWELGVMPSPILGGDGNQEFFALLAPA